MNIGNLHKEFLVKLLIFYGFKIHTKTIYQTLNFFIKAINYNIKRLI